MNKIKKQYLILSNINVENANALSSPYTIGFPAISAFLGFMHKIERQLNKKIENNSDIKNIIFDSLVIINNNFNFKAKKDKYSNYFISRKKAPLEKEKPASLQAEAFSNIEFSLIIKLKSFNRHLIDKDKKEFIIEKITNIINTIKFAGGDILPYNLNYNLDKDKTKKNQTKVEIINDISDEILRKHKLMTSYALLDKSDLLKKELENKKLNYKEESSESQNTKQKDILDIILEFLSIKNYCEKSEKNKEKPEWKSEKEDKGWIVPIVKGFQAISDLEKPENKNNKKVKHNKRDSETPHIFAESIVSIGEFKMLCHFSENKANNNNYDIRNLFWSYKADLKNNLYLCEQEKINKKEGGKSFEYEH